MHHTVARRVWPSGPCQNALGNSPAIRSSSMNVRYRPSSLVSAMSDSNVARKSALLSISDNACQLHRMLLKSVEIISRSVVDRSLPGAFKPSAELAGKRWQQDRKADRRQQSDHGFGIASLPPEALAAQCCRSSATRQLGRSCDAVAPCKRPRDWTWG